MASAMKIIDFYELLGVARDASPEDIERAFRQLARKYHPKLNPGDKAAEKVFRELVVAYRVLTNPEARRKYDASLEARARGVVAKPASEFFGTAPGSLATRRARARQGRRPPREVRHLKRRVAPRPQGTIKRKAIETAKRVPWWALSAAVHLLVLFILAKWNLPPRDVERAITPIEVSLQEVPLKLPDMDISPRISPQPPAIVPPKDEMPIEQIADPEAIDAVKKDQEARVFAVQNPFGTRGMRAGLVGRPGGPTAGSESAVEAALLWLATRQSRTGAWHTDQDIYRWADPGISALATLAFLGANYTHQNGKYRRTVGTGLSYLKQMQDTQGCIAFTFEDKRIGGYMYNHGIATLALAEAYGMTKDPLLREAASRAIDFIVRSQNTTGGWRYYENSTDADSSVSGWMIMALRSASLAGIRVPEKTYDGARRFFNSIIDKGKGVTYYREAGDRTSPALIAVGLLAHQYLDEKPDEAYIQLAGAIINKYPPEWIEGEDPVRIRQIGLTTSTNNYYYWYYANMALHQRRGDAWEQWHPRVRQLLTRIQIKEGRDAGSWAPLSYGGSVGGRVFSTAMGCLTLEVYYRYAPMFREVVDSRLAAYGVALSAYNDFVGLASAKSPDAVKAGAEARAKIEAFLEASKPKENEKLEKAAQERRGRAAMMLVNIDQVSGDFARAIAGLLSIQERFPGVLDDAARDKMLATCYLAQSRHLAEVGQDTPAREAEGKAVELFYKMVTRSFGHDPDIERWVASRLYERGDWPRAVQLYLEQAKPFMEKPPDPKSPEARRAASIFQRIVDCYAQFHQYDLAADWLGRLEKLVGPSLDMSRKRAQLLRLEKRYGEARGIYADALKRLPEHSKEWWQTWVDEMRMAYEMGDRQYVLKRIGKKEVLYPDLGGPELRPQVLELRKLAESGG